MGLDWLVDRRPKDGQATLFLGLRARLRTAMRGDDAALRKHLSALIDAASVSPGETLGAPRVGIDAEATEWFRREIYEHPDATRLRDRYPSFEKAVESEQGKFVLELAREKPPRPAVSGSFMCPELTSFRGRALTRCQGLDGDLADEAFQAHTATEALDYATRLDTAAPRVIEEHRQYVVGAAAWLRWWGERGHGFEPWY